MAHVDAFSRAKAATLKANQMHIRLAVFFSAVVAFPAFPADSNAHTWVTPAPLLERQAYFSNLVDGASIGTPWVLKFGLTGMGLSAITGVAEGTGHHHLLVNRELPLDFTKPLPFNSQYIHFGKGQMETVLNFPPGKYTLRLVLADNHHIPDFVYSKPIHVAVTSHDSTIDPKTLTKHEVAILAPKSDETVRAPFRIGFHASGYDISSIAVPDAGSGHFRLRLRREGNPDAFLEFENGHTEVWLSPPTGHYDAQLYLVDNNARGKLLATSSTISFDVAR